MIWKETIQILMVTRREEAVSIDDSPVFPYFESLSVHTSHVGM